MKNLKKKIFGGLAVMTMALGIATGASAASLAGISSAPVTHNQNTYWTDWERFGLHNANQIGETVTLQPQAYNFETQTWADMPWHSEVYVAPLSKNYVAYDNRTFPMVINAYYGTPADVSEYRFEVKTSHGTFYTEGFNSIANQWEGNYQFYYGEYGPYAGGLMEDKPFTYSLHDQPLYQWYWPTDIYPEIIPNN